MKKVGLVLINYQDYARRFLAACRDSLRLQDYPQEMMRVYIVDNASSQATRDFLAQIYPEAQILTRVDGNYAAANNLGCRQASADGCDLLVTVNMDTEMAPTWLSELVSALVSNSEFGLAQAKILLFPKNEREKQEPKINTLGNFCHFLGFGTTSAYGEPDREISGYPEISGYASGCCFIMRRELFGQVGGWNEDYYMYHDDIEFSLKVRLAGYKIVLAPKSIIFHKYEFSRSAKMLYYMERNRYLLVFSFYPAGFLLFLAPVFMIMDLGLLLFAILKGWLPTWLKARAFFLQPSSWLIIGRERRHLQRLAQIDFYNLAAGFKGKLKFSEIDNLLLRLVANPLLNVYWQFVQSLLMKRKS